VADNGRVQYLDGIRGLAIAAVLSLHWLSWYSPLFHGGSVGVDAFFVLSGFIITTVLWRAPASSSVPAAWASFLKRRVARLYPALLGLVVVATILYAIVPGVLDAADVARRGVPALTQTSALWAAEGHGSLWLPGLQPFGQTWSLAIEWYFYLLWPLVVLRARASGWSARGLAVTSLAAATVLYAGSLPLSTHWFYFGPSARSGELLVGAATALWLQGQGHGRGSTSRTSRFATPVAFAALLVVPLYSLVGADGGSELYRFVGVPATVAATVVLILHGYAGTDGVVRRLLSRRWLTTVGRHSYSLYLWHIVPMLLLQHWADDISRPLLGVAVVLATGCLTIASYQLLERPFLRARSDVLRSPAPDRELRRTASP
jgi:peptidoglycan/LPS O-acetylase OafA/YrhL